MQTIWNRRTPNFTVTLSYEWDDNMDLSWDDTGEAREKIESGEWGHYIFAVTVTENATGEEIGADYLGGSIYADPREFIDHRACGRQNREYAARGEPGRCGSYFTGMVAEAINQARKTYAMRAPHSAPPLDTLANLLNTTPANHTQGSRPMADKIKADVSAMRETTKNARRDTGFIREIAVINPATGNPIAIARIYQPGTVARCSVWISSRGNGTYGRGQGEAGGGGYHKASAALEAALRDAGVQISRAIGGVGDQAMRDALEAVAHAVAGRRRVIIHEAHA